MLSDTKLYKTIVGKEHHKYRHTVNWDLANEYARKGLKPIERMADRFERVCRETGSVDDRF